EASGHRRRPPPCPQGLTPWLCHQCRHQGRPPAYVVEVDGALDPRNYGHLCERNGRRAASHRGPHVVLSAEGSLTESAAAPWAYSRTAAVRSASCGAFARRPRVFFQARPGEAGVVCGDHPCPLEAL